MENTFMKELDAVFDNLFDDFNGYIIEKKLMETTDKIDFHMKTDYLDSIIINYFDEMDTERITKLLISSDKIMHIVNLMKIYCLYYMFLFIGYFHKGNLDSFAGNIVEVSKKTQVKIDGFFDSASTNNLLKNFEMIHEIIDILNKKKDTTQSPASEFLKEYDALIEDYFMSKDKNERVFYLLKVILVNTFYFGKDRSFMISTLESAESADGEYMFIDIVVPKTHRLNISSIESLLEKDEINSGLAYEIYEMILSSTSTSEISESEKQNRKIDELFKRGLVIPISEDFLLYHNSSVSYEKRDITSDKTDKTNTKVRFITSKVDSISNYYSPNITKKQQNEIDNEFYKPFSHRNTILINEFEEMTIIDRYSKGNFKTADEYVNDLINIRKYPYISFKEMSMAGATIIPKTSYDVVRLSSFFNYKKETTNPKLRLDVRNSNKDNELNIIGIVVPNTSNIRCFYGKNIIGVDKLKSKKQTTNFNKVSNYLTNNLFNSKEKLEKLNPIKWFFDDKTKQTTQQERSIGDVMSDDYRIKSMLSKLHDNIISKMHSHIINRITNIRTTNKDIPLMYFNLIIRHYENSYIKFPKNSPFVDDIKRHIFYSDKTTKSTRKYEDSNKYDKNEDKFHGLVGDFMKLKTISTNNLPHEIIRRTAIKNIKTDLMYPTAHKTTHKTTHKTEQIIGICQHFITEELIGKLRKSNPNKFEEKLQQFINRYALQTENGDYVCKSCGYYLGVFRFASEIVSDGEQMISQGNPIVSDLDSIREYEGMDSIIKSLTKIMTNFVDIFNMRYVMETKKFMRTAMITTSVKFSMDLATQQYKVFGDISKFNKRSNTLEKTYGISTKLTNFIVFELDNNIFMRTSKDKNNKIKELKQNNLAINMVLSVILNLSYSHIQYMVGDKSCNYFWFEKYGFELFNNIKIITGYNKTEYLSRNKTMCYVIYYLACMMIKYNRWNYDIPDSNAKKKAQFQTNAQKMIIHTLADVINSVLEVYYNPDTKNYLYDIISSKFLSKFNVDFKDGILERIKKIDNAKIKVVDGKKKYIQSKIKSIPIKFNKSSFYGSHHIATPLRSCLGARYYAPKRQTQWIRYNKINNITNCPDGSFHNWKTEKRGFVCGNCKTELSGLEIDKELSKKIRKKYSVFIDMKNRVKKKCQDCTDEQQITKTYNDIMKSKKTHDINEYHRKIELLDKQENQQTKNNRDMVNMKSSANKNSDIDSLMEFLKKYIGKDMNINNNNIYLMDDVYIVDHDHQGTPIDKPLIIVNNKKQINIRKNDPFFNKDVLFFTYEKGMKIEVYYDAITNLLIGYKESGKDYTISKTKNRYIKINYSIENIIRILGFSQRFYDVQHKINELAYLEDSFADNEKYKDFIAESIIIEIIGDRLNNLKKNVVNIQRFINRKIYMNDGQTKSGLESLKMKSKDIVFMDSWEFVLDNVNDLEPDIDGIKRKVPAIIKTPDNTMSFISSFDIIIGDSRGNTVQSFIIGELNKLYELNTNDAIRLNLSNSIIEFILNNNKDENEDVRYRNDTMRKFIHDLNSKSYVYDVDAEGVAKNELEGIYGEYVDPDDQIDPDKIKEMEELAEEADALDMEVGLGEDDYEIDYVPGVNIS